MLTGKERLGTYANHATCANKTCHLTTMPSATMILGSWEQKWMIRFSLQIAQHIPEHETSKL